MDDIASFGFDVRSESVTRANTELDKMPAKASAAERAAIRWGLGTTEAANRVVTANTAATRSVETLSTATMTLARVVGSVLGAAIGAFSLKKFIDATVEADKAQAQLAATLRSTAAVSGQTVESLNTHAAALQKVTVFSDDAVTSAQALLLTFTRIRGPEFAKATEAVLDMATALGTDLSSAATQVGKALNNPITGMAALSKAGVGFTESQKATAKQMTETGNIAGAQAIILKQLETQFGGSARAARETLGGALTSLKNAWGDLFELGANASEPLRKAVEDLISAVQDPAFMAFVHTIGTALVFALTLAIKAVTLLVNAISTAVNNIVPAVRLLLQPFNALLNLLGIDIIDAVANAANRIIGSFRAAAIDIEFVWSHFPDVMKAAAAGAGNALIAGIEGALNILIPQVKAFYRMLNPIAGLADKMGGKVGDIFGTGILPDGVKFGRLNNPAAGRLTGDNVDETTGGISATPGGALGQRNRDVDAAWNKNYLGAIGDAFRKATADSKNFSGGLKTLTDDLGKMGAAAKDAYGKIVQGALQFIAAQKLEAESLGLSAVEAARLKNETDLLNKAANDNLKLTPAQVEHLKDLAKQMAVTSEETRKLKFLFEAGKEGKEFIAQQELAASVIGMTAAEANRATIEFELFAKARKANIDLTPEEIAGLREIAGAMADAKTRTDQMTESVSFVKGIFSDLFSDLKDALLQGKNLWQSFGDAALGVLSKVADKLLNMGLDGLLSGIMGGTSSSSSGGGILGALGGFFGGGSGIPTPRSQGINVGSIGGMPSGFNYGGGGGIGGFFSNIWNNTPSWLGGGGMGSFGFGNALGAIGGLASAGMGFARGGTGGTIGGIAGLLGAGVSLIPGIGQIAGPIIGLLGGLLPGLFEQEKKPPKLMATGGLNFNAGKWNYNGSEYNGGQGLGGTLGPLGGTMKSLMDAAGVKSLSSTNSLNYQTLSQGEFSSASTFVNGMQWGQGSGADAGLDTAAAHIAHKIMLEVDSGISDFMRKGLTGYGQKNLEHAFSTEELATAVSELKALETIMKDLGRTIPGTETALKAIDDQFKALKDSAEKYGLDTTKIVDEQAKARSKIASDFAAGLQRQYDDLTGNTIKGALADIKEDYDDAIANNKYLVENVKGATDQILLIEKLFGEKRTQVAIEQANQFFARENYLFVQRQALTGQLQAMNDNTAAIGANPMALQVKAWQREMADFVRSVGDTFGVGSTEYLDATLASYNRFNAQMKAANDDFIQTMNDGLLDPFELQIKTLMRQRDAAMETARALDASGKLVEEASLAFLAPLEKIAKDLNTSASDQLLEAKDPLAYAQQKLRQERDEALRNAGLVNEALGAIYGPELERISERYAIGIQNFKGTTDPTTGLVDKSGFRLDAADQEFLNRTRDSYVNLLQIEELYLKKEAALKEQYYAQSLSSLQDVIKRLTYGDLSGVSSAATLAGTRGAYQATLAQAMAGEQMGIQNLAGVAEAFVTASRDFYAETSDFFRTTQQVRSDLVAVDANVRSGGGGESSGGLSDAGVAALVGSNRELAESSADENRQLRAELRELKDLLLRKLAA